MKTPLVTVRRDRSSALSVLAHCTPIGLAILGLLWWAVPGSGAPEQPAAKNVLLVFSDYGQRAGFVETFESALRARVAGEITFHEAYLENPPAAGDSYLDHEADTLRRRFEGAKLDLVMPVSPPALLFTLQYHVKMFPGVPIVFTGVGTRQFGGKTWPGVTGLTTPVGLGETIDLALRLEPDTKAIALISPYDPFWLDATHSEILRYRDRVREIDLIGPPGRELYERVLALPPHTVVLFDLSPLKSGQPPLAGLDLIDAVAARLPTFSPWPDLCLNHGGIGGAYPDVAKLTSEAAGIAARVLSGERPDDIPIEHSTAVQVQVDWRALRRWHIPESALPPGSVILYREPTLWERGQKYFVAAIIVIVLQSFLIFALFWQRARKRQAEEELRRSEEKFSKSFRESPLVATITRMSDSCYLDVNETFEQRTGWSREEVIGRTPHDLGLWVDPAQRISYVHQLLAQGRVRDWEICFRRKDGQTRTALLSAGLIEVAGELCALTVVADITERKQAEEVLSTMSRRLIEAQDEERTRIARELHDDINQRIAIVSVNLETLKNELSDSELHARFRVAETQQLVSDLGNDVQALSHRLHSSKLDYLGLGAACRGFCRELSERQKVEIEFHSDGVPAKLSKEVSLCLFRVLQEALQNAVKHSGVREFHVSLQGTSDGVDLRVHDSGCGFDPEKATSGHGLGLTSMKERLKLVEGILTIDSKPQHGTTVHARVSLNGMSSGL